MSSALTVVLSAGHGLQWLWPFMLAYEPGRTAILDDICIVHPRDELQQALEVALNIPPGGPSTRTSSASRLRGWSQDTTRHEQAQVCLCTLLYEAYFGATSKICTEPCHKLVAKCRPFS